MEESRNTSRFDVSDTTFIDLQVDLDDSDLEDESTLSSVITLQDTHVNKKASKYIFNIPQKLGRFKIGLYI